MEEFGDSSRWVISTPQQATSTSGRRAYSDHPRHTSIARGFHVDDHRGGKRHQHNTDIQDSLPTGQHQLWSAEATFQIAATHQQLQSDRVRSGADTATVFSEAARNTQPGSEHANGGEYTAEEIEYWSKPPLRCTLSGTPPVLFTMSNARKPQLWQFIKLAAHPDHWTERRLENKHAAFAYCERCEWAIAFTSGNSGITRHMKKYHGDALASSRELRDDINRDLVLTFDDAAGSDSTHSHEPRAITTEQQDHINALLARWIGGHYRPLLMIVDVGFLNFVQYITEELGGFRVRIPKRAQLRRKIVQLAEDLRRQVRQSIARSCLFFSITSDIWSSRNARSYIAFTNHYVTENFDSVNWTLEVKEIPGKHDGQSIATALEEMMEDWDLRKDRCSRFVRDSGSNMVASGNIMQLDHAACIAHEIHLILSTVLKKKKRSFEQGREAWDIAVESEPDAVSTEYEGDDELSEADREQMQNLRDDILEEMDTFVNTAVEDIEKDQLAEMRDIVQKFRSLAVYFRKSPKARNRLALLQAEKLRIAKKDVVNPVVDCPTRWNSCYDMLCRFISLEKPLGEFFVYLPTPEGLIEFADMQSKLTRPKAADWLAIKCLVEILAPFASVSTMLGGQSYPTLSLVLPALSGLRKRLLTESLFAEHENLVGGETYVDDTMVTVKECRNAIVRLFDTRFERLERTELLWVPLLDPRVAKWMGYLPDKEKKKLARLKLINALVDLVRAEPPPTPDDQHGSMFSPPSASKAPNDAQIKHFMFGPNPRRQRQISLKKTCETEYDRYLVALKVADENSPEFVDPDTNPLQWWKKNHTTYNNLAKLARKWLGAVATSVPSERAFSTSGNIVTVKRASLAPELVRDLVFITENMRRENYSSVVH